MAERASLPPAARVDAVAARLAAAGFLAAEEEAAQLAARAPHDDAALDALVQRRLAGEPLAWITGSVMFCDVSVRVEPGVYVPRPHTELLAWRAIGRLPERGVAVDLCTGSGAVAVALATHRPRARIVASDIDARAVVSARRNRVDVYHGDLFAPLPRSLHADVDVVTGVVPYVPTADLPYLQRDTFTFESALAYDGGAHGMRVLRRVVRDATRFLRPGGTLLLELGGDQPTMIERDLERRGYRATGVIVDVDGDVRGIEATLNPP